MPAWWRKESVSAIYGLENKPSGQDCSSRVHNLQNLMPDDLRWSWYNNNNRNKVHRKCDTLDSFWNIPHPLSLWKNCLSWNQSLVPKTLGTAAVVHPTFFPLLSVPLGREVHGTSEPEVLSEHAWRSGSPLGGSAGCGGAWFSSLHEGPSSCPMVRSTTAFMLSPGSLRLAVMERVLGSRAGPFLPCVHAALCSSYPWSWLRLSRTFSELHCRLWLFYTSPPSHSPFTGVRPALQSKGSSLPPAPALCPVNLHSCLDICFLADPADMPFLPILP